MFGHVLCLIVVLVVGYVASASQLFSVRAAGSGDGFGVYWGGAFWRYSTGYVKLYSVHPTHDGYAVTFPGRKPFKRKFGSVAEARQFARRLCA